MNESTSIYSNASHLFGMNITFYDNKHGIIEASFQATDIFTNTIGNIQGGILTAMLDDLMGYALGITMPVDTFAPTANLNVSLIRPVAVGELHGRGQILKRDGDVYHLAAKLFNKEGLIVASSTAKAKRGSIIVA